MMTNDDTQPEGMAVHDHVPGARGGRELNAHLVWLTVRMIEMEQGLRPTSFLDRQASPLAARRIHHQVHWAKLGRPDGVRHTAPVEVLSVRSLHPTAGVTEGVVVVSHRDHVRGYSLRLEQEGTRWWIVDLATPDVQIAASVTAASREGRVPTDGHGLRWSSGGPDPDDAD